MIIKITMTKKNQTEKKLVFNDWDCRSRKSVQLRDDIKDKSNFWTNGLLYFRNPPVPSLL